MRCVQRAVNLACLYAIFLGHFVTLVKIDVNGIEHCKMLLLLLLLYRTVKNYCTVREKKLLMCLVKISIDQKNSIRRDEKTK